MNRPTSHQQFPHLFALIIGINKYLHGGRELCRDLNYCVADADAMSRFLQYDLGVPTSQIRNLRNEEATRQNIIDGIKAFGTNDCIKKATSSIFIFFAGHGSTSACIDSKETYEVLCPSDINLDQDPLPSSYVYGIPDYEIRSLINTIANAEAKGNNITLFFDCCHAAGMNRNMGSVRQMMNPAPLLQEKLRGGDVVPNSSDTNHESHVLMSACGKGQSAQECPHLKHGLFTSALLRLLEKTPIQTLTYKDMLSSLDLKCPTCRSSPLPQQPHCDGLHVNRKVFDLSIDDSELDRCEVSGNTVFTIPRGKIEGVLPQSLFYVYLEKDAEQHVGELVVTEVKDRTAKLSFHPLGAQFSVPKSFCFVKQMSGFADSKLFSDDRVRLDDIFPEKERSRSDIRLVDLEEDADICVRFKADEVQVYRRTDCPESRVLGGLLRAIPLSDAQLALPDVLRKAALFYHHLLRSGPKQFPEVEVELLYVEQKDEDEMANIHVPDADAPKINIIRSSNGSLSTVIDVDRSTSKSRPVGMRLQNLSKDVDLFPYVFYFNPADLEIFQWNSISLAQKNPDIPLPRQGVLDIGFKTSSCPPYQFSLTEDQEQDIGYFKIFLSTEPRDDLGRIAQPFIRGGGPLPPNRVPRTVLSWGTKVVEVLHPRSGTPKPHENILISNNVAGPLMPRHVEIKAPTLFYNALSPLTSTMSEASGKDDLLLKLVNVLVYCLFLSSTIYTISAPSDGYYTGKETYITTPPWVFIIWTLINILLFGTVICQWFPSGKTVVINGSISQHFPLLGVLNAIYVHLWADHHYIISFIFALFISFTTTHMSYVIKKDRVKRNDLVVHLPFSLFGGTTILTVLSLFEVFSVNGMKHKACIWTKICLFLALFFLEAVAAAYAFSPAVGDLPASIPVVWSLWAIYARQTSSSFWTPFVFGSLTLFWVIKDVCVRAWGGAVRREVETMAPRVPRN